jgi:GNAT superfamily N-acetyltransferase
MRIERVDVESPQARELLREYFTEVVSRLHRRPATDAEVDGVMADQPNERLATGVGVFLVAFDDDGIAIGCIGLRVIDDGVGEIKRMYVRPAGRGKGVGGALLLASEERAAEMGLREIKLDTRSELVEARGLYTSRGYVEVEPYNDNVYAQHWYSKQLSD